MQSHISRLRALLGALAAVVPFGLANAGSLDVNPLFPAYGQEVVVQLNDAGPAPYVPATRMRRSGDNIVLELEHIAGGFFGPRADMYYAPFSLGELAPGHYALQARLFDISDPDAPPRLFSSALDVAPPDALGVYPVPRNPGAYEAIQLVVHAEAGIDPKSLRATVTDDVVHIDFNFTPDPAAASFATVRIAGVRPGNYRVQAFGTYPTLMAPPYVYAGAFHVDATTTAVEYYAEKSSHYFTTPRADEIAALDAGTTYQRTGERFKVWLNAADAPASAVPVHRFYLKGPDSHFYTASAQDYETLRSIEQKDRAEAAAKGQAFQGWAYEGIGFYAIAATDGKCPAATRGVYRAYNMRWADNDSNHRFMATGGMRAAMWSQWADEGLAFCAPL
jgi:hypothetical protein